MACKIDRNATLRELFKLYNQDKEHDAIVDKAAFAVLEMPCEEGVGGWIFTDDGFKCSECGTRFADVVTGYDTDTKTEKMWKFCPNCGIAMENEMREEWVKVP